MAFTPSPARYPVRRVDADDPRFLDLLIPDAASAHILLAGIPFDGAVIGRKGAKLGPTAIREAFRYLGGWDPDAGQSLKGLRIHDAGDAPVEAGVLATHKVVQAHLTELTKLGKPLVVLGGDNSLSYPTFRALQEAYGGKWGLIVIDAHYDLRPYEGEPTSGTPYRRILEEAPGQPLHPRNLVEVGIRAYANAPSLANYAKEKGVHIVSRGQVRDWGIAKVVAFALEHATAGVDHLMLSVDIDALDQSIASGCSAPGADGLTFHEAATLVNAVARHPKCRAMDLVEVAPELDPTGNTSRTAAQLVAAFAAGLHARLGTSK